MTRSEVRVPHRPPGGDIAQLARAPALQAGGPGFESLCLHQRKSTSSDVLFLCLISIRLVYTVQNCLADVAEVTVSMLGGGLRCDVRCIRAG
jgi:hypothetical protein